MPEPPRTIYLDSCVVTSYLANEPDRIGVLRTIFDEAGQSNQLRLYTSVLSITEVAYLEAESESGLPDEDLQRIEDFWAQGPIVLVEASTITMREARRVLRRSRIRHSTSGLPSVRSADALHLGTALWLQVDEFWTYDGPLKKWSQQFDGMVIREPWTSRPRLFD